MVADRLSRREAMMQHAVVASQRSTCDRLHVGAIVARDSRIISTGYNGPPSGFPHCDHAHDLSQGAPCTAAVHAEANALVFAARVGARTEGCELYVTHQPCLACAMLVVNAGIEQVYYGEPYRDHSGVALLVAAGIGCTKAWPW